MKAEIADVKVKKAENQAHLAEINKNLHQKSMLNEDKQDDLQLIVDENSQLKVHLAKNKYAETRLQEEELKLQEKQAEIVAKISTNQALLDDSVKTLENTEKARTEILDRLKKADETLADWTENFADREAKELSRRERVSSKLTM